MSAYEFPLHETIVKSIQLKNGDVASIAETSDRYGRRWKSWLAVTRQREFLWIKNFNSTRVEQVIEVTGGRLVLAMKRDLYFYPMSAIPNSEVHIVVYDAEEGNEVDIEKLKKQTYGAVLLYPDSNGGYFRSVSILRDLHSRSLPQHSHIGRWDQDGKEIWQLEVQNFEARYWRFDPEAEQIELIGRFTDEVVLESQSGQEIRLKEARKQRFGERCHITSNFDGQVIGAEGLKIPAG